MTAPAWHVVEHHYLVARKFWRANLMFSVLSPLMFLAAMGVGIGSLVSRGRGPAQLGGVSYVDFVGPGLLAASVMQVAAGDNMWPIMGGLKWQKTFHAMVSTPISSSDLVTGHFLFTALRLAVGGLGYMIALVAFGVVDSWWAVLALPAAVLCGMAFAAPIAAFAATQETDQTFIVIFRVVIMPLFLFGGAFFPIERLPTALEAVAHFTPLWHGVELVRGLVLGTLELARIPLHVGYLTVWIVVGWMAATRTFRRRLVQ